MPTTQVTILSDEVRIVEGRASDGRVVVAPTQLADAIGWELKPEGLCRDDSCVPVADATALFVGQELDLAAVAAALGRQIVVDDEVGIAALSLDAGQRRRALEGLQAPAFTMDDLDGRPHSLGEWHGRKRLLVAFASW
jgi:hypothetical protein